MLNVKVSRIARLVFAIAIGAAYTGAAFAAEGNVDLPRYPSISPDGQHIVFSWRGDLWKVPAAGGQAARLTSHGGDDHRSAWSRDGQRIAFNSDRTGHTNIHVMNADGTGIRQVTDTDVSCYLSGFGFDDKGKETITFFSWIEADAYYSARPFFVYPDGGELHRLHDAFGDEPAVSPDGRRIVFTRGNNSWFRRHYRGPGQLDVWLYDRTDGSFKQLTTWKGNDGKARWIDDAHIAFLSDRQDRTVNLYQMNIEQGEPSVRRLTEFKGRDIYDHDVSFNGKRGAFVMWDALYTLDLTDLTAKPQAVTIHAAEDEADRFALRTINKDVTEAALSPDGKVMAVVAYGEVFVRNVDDGSPTQRITDSIAREKEIAWSPDGLRLYFVSDRDGTESIYEATVKLTRGEIKKQFTETIDPPAKKEPQAKPAAPNEDGDAKTDEGDGEKKPDEAKKPEEKPLPKELNPARWHDAVEFTIKPVVKAKSLDREPSPSPDGKQLAFRRGRGGLVILDRVTGKQHTLVSGWDSSLHWAWSPDGRHIAYSQNDRDFNADIWIIPADGASPPVNVSRHPDNDVAPVWSADGKVLSFLSQRVNDEYDLWVVYLDKSLEGLIKSDLEAYYKKGAEAAKKRKPIPPVDLEAERKKLEEKKSDGAKAQANDGATIPGGDAQWSLDDAYRRLRRLTSFDGNEWNNAMTPAGDMFLFTGSGGYDGLWVMKWDGSDRKKIGGRVDVQHLTLAGDKAVYVDGGRAGVVTLTGAAKAIDIDAQLRIDLAAQSSQKFREAARIIGEHFYHPKLKGLNWRRLTNRYHALAQQARTGGEFDYIANHFLGELNGSHLGIRSPEPSNPLKQAYGWLGSEHRRVGRGFLVTAVTPGSPAAASPTPLLGGDVITAVELKPIPADGTVESALKGRAGNETIVTVRRNVNGKAQSLNLLITPTTWGNLRNLKYDAWQQHNAKLVHEWSDGKLGYLHIRSMGQSSLDEYERDLYAAAHGRAGLLIDVRNNGGGWTTDRLLASIMARPHAYTVPRGADPKYTDGYPQDRLFIQRYTRPVNMLCNERSFSNAEIISHAFKTLKRGKLVGQTTFGGVISTGRTTLLDGTRVSVPFRGWYLPGGTDMENHGAVPHLLVPQTPQAEAAGADEQLKAAVDDLLKRIK